MRPAPALLLVLACAGCGGWQSATQPGGPVARELHGLFSLFTITAALVWLATMLMLAAALLRRRREEERQGRGPALIIGGAVVATVVIVGGLTLASFLATRSIASAPADALVIRLRASQWWWEVTYDDPSPDRVLVTANEIRVPVGRPVRVELSSADVIHSFWVPALAGKQDMLPGRANALSFTAERPGVFRGQCAEFCGLQHAHMALHVVAEPPDAFERWRDAQLAPAAAPVGPEEEEGRRIVESRACGACHTVRGTAAAGLLGPDLTHVAARPFIAAGMLPTTRGSIAAWIADPQTIKPGNTMPMVTLSPGELQAVTAYLMRLR